MLSTSIRILLKRRSCEKLSLKGIDGDTKSLIIIFLFSLFEKITENKKRGPKQFCYDFSFDKFQFFKKILAKSVLEVSSTKVNPTFLLKY